MKYDCICTQGSHKEGDKCVQGSQVPKTLNCRVVKTVDSHEKFMSTFCHILPMGVVAMEQTSRLDHQPLLEKGARASYERRVRT